MKEEIVIKTQDIFNGFGYELDLNDNIRIENLGISSFNMIKIIVAIEDTFNIDFNFEEMDISNFDTTDKIINMIEEKGKIKC